MKKSTAEFLKEAGKTKNYSFWDLIHGYFYMRWPYFYISMAKGDHPLAKRMGSISRLIKEIFPLRDKKGERKDSGKGITRGYHGKALPLETAKELVSVKEEIRLENLEQVIPYERARDIILKNPDHIVVIDCPCRKGMEHHCEPMDVCLIVGEPFASFVLEHHPDSSRSITSEEARAILEEEAQRGHVAHAFFKDAVLNRFYAICNCCSCCCGAMKAHRNGTPMVFSSGYISVVNDERCVLCASCLDYCQFGALSIDRKLTINADTCMGCGLCALHCPQEALSLRLDPSKPMPLKIGQLANIKQ